MRSLRQFHLRTENTFTSSLATSTFRPPFQRWIHVGMKEMLPKLTPTPPHPS